MHDDHAVLREKLRRDDGVGDAGFVFKAEEDEAFGGAGALAGDDAAGDADAECHREDREVRWRSGCLGASVRAR